MMKFFRKYNKQLLALFMALLMIVFIGGSALEGMLTPSQNRVVANSRLGEINYIDQQNANGVTQLLDAINMNWRQPVGGGTKPLEPVDWILLSREAQTLGTPIDLNAVRTSLPEDTLENLARTLRVRPMRLLEAMGEFKAIQQTALSVAVASTPSEAAVQAAARDSLETVKVNTVMLPAQAFVDPEMKFTEDEMQAHFEKYKDNESGEGLSFGYYQHPALKVQYINILRDKVAGQIKIANLEKEAKAYYEENRTKERKLRRPADQMPANQEGPAPEPYLSWEEGKGIAETAVREKHADTAVEKLANWLIQYASEPWADVARGKDGYKTPPLSALHREFYDDLVKRVPASLSFDDAVQVWTSDWFTHQNANEVPMIGNSFFMPSGSPPTPFKNLVVRNQFFVPEVPTDEGVNSADYSARYQSSPYALKNRLTGDTFVYRVVEGRAGRPANSLSEVREEVDANLRLLQAYETAQAHASALLACDPGMTLKEAFENDEELQDLRKSEAGAGLSFYEPSAVSRVPKYMSGQGRPKDGIMVSGGVGLVPNEVVDGWFAMEDGAEKKAMFELPQRATVLVAEWMETKRPDDESYLTLREQLTTQIAEKRWQAALSEWLDPEQIRARNGFDLVEQ